jgi:hypothetical protein
MSENSTSWRDRVILPFFDRPSVYASTGGRKSSRWSCHRCSTRIVAAAALPASSTSYYYSVLRRYLACIVGERVAFTITGGLENGLPSFLHGLLVLETWILETWITIELRVVSTCYGIGKGETRKKNKGLPLASCEWDGIRMGKLPAQAAGYVSPTPLPLAASSNATAMDLVGYLLQWGSGSHLAHRGAAALFSKMPFIRVLLSLSSTPTAIILALRAGVSSGFFFSLHDPRR